MCIQKSSKEPILEEGELDFRPLEECEEGLEEDDCQPRETKEMVAEARGESDREGQLVWLFYFYVCFFSIINLLFFKLYEKHR